jgi:hypothetical protein
VGRRIDVDLLVGTAEIADRLGLNQPETVHAWRRRHPDFPAPVKRLQIGYVWNWPDIERWAKATGRLPGREG